MASNQVVTRRLQIIIDESGAEKAYEKLQKSQDKLIKAIEKGKAAGKDMTKELQELEGVQKQTQHLSDILSGKLEPTLRQARSAASNLRRELNGMSQDAPGFAQRMEAYKQVSAQLGDMEKRVTGFRSAAKSIFSEIKTVALGVTIGNTIQAITQSITGMISGAISGAAKLSDEITDIEKAAELTTRQTEKLNKELSKIDTRTSNSDLRGIAVGLGQAGQEVTADNVREVDRINVALGDEFGGDAREISNTLTVLRNNLADIKTQNFGEDIGKIGNALNVMGAEGLATAPVVSDISNRISGVGQTFGVTSGQIIGTAAAFQELGINVERGSTAYTKLLQKMATDTSTFAKVAGMELKQFQQLVNTDINEALLLVAKGSKEAAGSNTAFAATLQQLETEGAGVSELLAKLATNGDLVRQKIDLASKALTNTDSIMSEFEKKNNNLAGQLEKLGKNFAGVFNSPMIRSGAASIIGWLNDLFEGGNKANKAVEEQSNKLKQLDRDIDPLLSRYDQLTSRTDLNAQEHAELRSIINEIVDVIPEAAGAFDAYGNTIDINRDKISQYVATNQKFLRELELDAVKSLQGDVDKSLSEIRRLQEGIEDYRKKAENANEANAKHLNAITDQWTSRLRQEQKNLVDNAELLQKKYGIELSASIMQAVDTIRLLQNELPTVQIADARQFDIKKNKPAAAAIALSEDKDAKTKAEKAQRDAEKRRKDLEALLRDLQKMEQDIYKKSNDDYAAALAEITFKYNEIIQRAQNTVFKSANQKMDTEKRILEDFVAEMQNVNRRFQKEEKEPTQPPGEAADGNPIKKRIDDEVNAISAANRKESELAKAGLALLKATNSEKLQTTVENIEARLQAEKKYNEVLMLQEISAANGNGEKIALIKETYLQRNAELNREAYAAQVDEMSSYLDTVAGYATQVNDILSSINASQMNEVQSRYDAEQERYREMLDNKLISQREYDRRVSASNKKMNAEQKALAEEQFKRNKAFSIGQAIISMAIAIAKASEKGWPQNLILMAEAAAIGAAQIANITSAKPQYGDGGMLPEGSSHAQGGIGLRDNRTGNYVGTIEGGEPIISRGVYAANRPLINALLAKGYNRDFTPITPDWLTAMPSRLNVPLISRSLSTPRFADGGILPNQQQGQKDADANRLLLQALLDRLNQPIYANMIYGEWEVANNTMNSIRSSGTMA